MARELECAVLGGYNFVETLKLISQEMIAARGVRPLLLIDDLVQSMNIYSTDLLDFFITMISGNSKDICKQLRATWYIMALSKPSSRSLAPNSDDYGAGQGA